MIKVFATSNMHYTPFNGFHSIDLPYFKENNIEIVSNPREADIIVSQHFKQLKPFFFKYFTKKKYLIWTLEPRFNTHQFPIKTFFLTRMKVHIMNIYTGDVFISPLSFHCKNITGVLPHVEGGFKLLNRTLVGLMSYYKGLNTESVMYRGRDVDLIKKRTIITLYGQEQGLMHVYGKGWPEGISKEDSRDGNWNLAKIGILDSYSFNLCFENTAVPRYMTEKIWDSIANYCLPVYYGAGTEIYDLFPENSFIDYSLMESPQELFAFLQVISDEEYIKRMNKCIDVYNMVSQLSDNEKYKFREMSLGAIVSKLNILTR